MKKRAPEIPSFATTLASFVAFAVGIVFGVMMQPTVIKFYETTPRLSVSADMPANLGSDKKDDLIVAQVQSAVSMLEALNEKVEAGSLTLAQAKKIGADELRAMHYGDDGYFFADTVDGVNVVLPGHPEVEGTNRLNAELNGVRYVERIVSVGKSGGGYTNYFYPKPGETTPSTKRAYSMHFAPFDWVVGTGYYK